MNRIWTLVPLLVNAAACGGIPMMQALINFGADCNQANEYGMFPVEAAAKGGKLEALKFLIQNGAKIGTPKIMHFALAGSKIKLIAYLFENYNRDLGFSDLHIAVYKGDIDSVDTLLKDGGDIFANSEYIISPLYLAIFCCKFFKNPVLEHLMKQKKIDLNMPMTEPFLAERGYRNIPLVVLLLMLNFDESTLKTLVGSERVNFNQILELGGESMTIAFLFASRCKWEGLRILTANSSESINVDANSEGRTLDFFLERDFWEVLEKGKPETVRFMIKMAANVQEIRNGRGSNRGTILHYAATNPCMLELIPELLKMGLDVNVQNNYDETPLHFAIEHFLGEEDNANKLKAIKMIESLINYGADLFMEDDCKKTSHSLLKANFLKAIDGKEPEIIKFMIRMKVDLKSIRDTESGCYEPLYV